MKVVPIVSPRDVKQMLIDVECLRARVQAGEVVAFSIVVLHPDDSFRTTTNACENVSRIRMQGAIAQLLHDFIANGDL